MSSQNDAPGSSDHPAKSTAADVKDQTTSDAANENDDDALIDCHVKDLRLYVDEHGARRVNGIKSKQQELRNFHECQISAELRVRLISHRNWNNDTLYNTVRQQLPLHSSWEKDPNVRRYLHHHIGKKAAIIRLKLGDDAVRNGIHFLKSRFGQEYCKSTSTYERTRKDYPAPHVNLMLKWINSEKYGYGCKTDDNAVETIMPSILRFVDWRHTFDKKSDSIGKSLAAGLMQLALGVLTAGATMVRPYMVKTDTDGFELLPHAVDSKVKYEPGEITSFKIPKSGDILFATLRELETKTLDAKRKVVFLKIAEHSDVNPAPFAQGPVKLDRTPITRKQLSSLIVEDADADEDSDE